LKKLYIAIGIDCDPDRDAYPRRLAWRGIEAIPRLFDIPDLKWTFNIRADSQVQAYCGAADYCVTEYRELWSEAEHRGDALALHLHYFGDDGRQDITEANIRRNVELGVRALHGPDLVHMGWTFQNDFSIRQLAAAGIKVDYSPLPRMTYGGRNGTDQYDWSSFCYRPTFWHGVKMVPAYTYMDSLLSRRFGTERVMLTTATSPLLYRLLLKSFFGTGSDFFVSYFHIDEIISALSGWRSRLYSFDNLRRNIDALRERANDAGYDVHFLNIRELAGILFDDHHAGDA
jgi:hypothetical protein